MHNLKLKYLEPIIKTNRIYLWFNDDCIKINDIDYMFKKYGECKVESIYDDSDALVGSHLDIEIHIGK